MSNFVLVRKIVSSGGLHVKESVVGPFLTQKRAKQRVEYSAEIEYDALVAAGCGRCTNPECKSRSGLLFELQKYDDNSEFLESEILWERTSFRKIDINGDCYIRNPFSEDWIKIN